MLLGAKVESGGVRSVGQSWMGGSQYGFIRAGADEHPELALKSHEAPVGEMIERDVYRLLRAEGERSHSEGHGWGGSHCFPTASIRYSDREAP